VGVGRRGTMQKLHNGNSIAINIFFPKRILILSGRSGGFHAK
jgi:hypothetical protein